MYSGMWLCLQNKNTSSNPIHQKGFPTGNHNDYILVITNNISAIPISCNFTKCRRLFLLEKFGDKYASETCYYYDQTSVWLFIEIIHTNTFILREKLSRWPVETVNCPIAVQLSQEVILRNSISVKEMQDSLAQAARFIFPCLTNSVCITLLPPVFRQTFAETQSVVFLLKLIQMSLSLKYFI